jgi:hypothetical protein
MEFLRLQEPARCIRLTHRAPTCGHPAIPVVDRDRPVSRAQTIMACSGA